MAVPSFQKETLENLYGWRQNIQSLSKRRAEIQGSS